MMFCKKKCSPSRSFCHLHLSLLGVDRCCKRQTLFKCHKSRTKCPERSKTHGLRSGTPPLLSALRARASTLNASCQPIGVHHLLLSNLTTVDAQLLFVMVRYCSESSRHRYRKMKMECVRHGNLLAKFKVCNCSSFVFATPELTKGRTDIWTVRIGIGIQRVRRHSTVRILALCVRTSLTQKVLNFLTSTLQQCFFIMLLRGSFALYLQPSAQLTFLF